MVKLLQLVVGVVWVGVMIMGVLMVVKFLRLLEEMERVMV